jgi:glycosyltransferase involved in cell wall biosynthesis
MDSQPLVSIVTPAYNQASFLRDTIESVLNQDYPCIEYRVLDDGSTDTTPAILETYTGRLLWETHSNRGQTATINKGWEQAGGSILTWLNSDDTLLPGAVSRVVAYFEKHPDVDLVYGDTLFTSADGTPLRQTGPQAEFDYRQFVLLCTNPIPQPSAFLRRRVVERVGLLDGHYRYFMDWDYWLRAGLTCKIAYFPELLSTYRLHPESNTVSQSARVAPELEYMYERYFARDDLPPDIRRVQQQATANMYFTSGGYYMKGGDCSCAARMGVKAIRAFPGLLCRPRMLHKLAYCVLGASRLYRGMRSIYHRARPSPEAACRAAFRDSARSDGEQCGCAESAIQSVPHNFVKE